MVLKKTLVSAGRGLELNSPLRIRGEGHVDIGDYTAFGYELSPRTGTGEIEIQPRYQSSKVLIGSNCEISNNTTIISLVEIEIGDGCLIGDHCLIIDSNFHDIDPLKRMDLSLRSKSDGESSPIRVEPNVWIGSRVTILKGVSIGTGAVIGAGSVVRNSVPANTTVSGFH